MANCGSFSRNVVGSYQLRERTSQTSDGTVPGACPHSGQKSFLFNPTLHSTLSSWITTLNASAQTGGGLSVSWVGTGGTCASKVGPHNTAEAFDLTHIRFTNSSYVDLRYSQWGSTLHKRRYLAVVAACRRFFGYVMTQWSDSDGSHWHHLHLDNYYRGLGPLLHGSGWGRHSDTTLIQSACNLLNNAGISVDGQWGQNTENAYLNLLTALNMRCYNPKTSNFATDVLLHHIALHGFGNRAAGYWRAGC